MDRRAGLFQARRDGLRPSLRRAIRRAAIKIVMAAGAVAMAPALFSENPALAEKAAPPSSQKAEKAISAASPLAAAAPMLPWTLRQAGAADKGAGASSYPKTHALRLADLGPALEAAQNQKPKSAPSSAAGPPAAPDQKNQAAAAAPKKLPPSSAKNPPAGASQKQKRGLASGSAAAVTFVNKDGKTLKFAGEADPALSPAQAQNLWNQINARLRALREYCNGSRASIQKTKSLAAQLQLIQKQAAAVYEKHKDSLGGAKIKTGRQITGLGPVLLDISTVLQMQYGQIQQSASPPAACQALKDSFMYSLYSYYNIPDEADLSQRLSHWARTALSAVQCACPEKR